MKHITLWCLPRTGTTAYCNHLVNTGQVRTDGAQELFERAKFWPVFDNESIDTRVIGLTPDREFKDNKMNNDISMLNEKVLLDNYKKDWIWHRHVSTDDGIQLIKTKTPPNADDFNNHEKNMMNMLNNQNIPHVIKMYAHIPLDVEDITYPTYHHFILRDPLDATLSQCFVDETKVWHILDNHKNKLSVNSDFVIDCSTKKVRGILHQYCMDTIKIMNKLKNVQHTLIRYEDLFNKNLNTDYKKMWTKEYKLSHCVNLSAVDDILDMYKNMLES